MSSQYYRAGDLFGVIYRFKAGEGLPTHVHERHDLRHNVIVLKGSVRIRDVTVTAGDPPFNVDDDQPHSITALEDSTILNLCLYGVPKDCEDVHSGDDTGDGDG